jgi:hypothetical protein
MIAYAQLEVMAMLPSLQVAKLQQPPKIDGADIKVQGLTVTRPTALSLAYWTPQRLKPSWRVQMHCTT